MKKDIEEKAVAPSEVSAHLLDGWNVIGTAEVDADGKMVSVTGKIIETPAHTIETSDHFLKVMPKFDEFPEVIVPEVKAEVKAEVKPEEKIKK
jgi:hypothetical protein